MHGFAAPGGRGTRVIEQLEERSFPEGEIASENGAVGTIHSELLWKPQFFTIEGGHFLETICSETNMGEAFDHAALLSVP